MKRLTIATVLLTASFAIAAAPTTRPIYATPADVVAATMKATREGNLEIVLDTQTSASKDKLTKLIVTLVVRAPATRPMTDPATTARAEKAAAEKAAFVARHRLTDHVARPGETQAQLIDRLTAGIEDQRALLLDFMQQTAKERRPSTRPAPELENVVMDADGLHATGDMSVRDSGGGKFSQHLKFTKVEGSWLLESPLFY